MDAILVVLAVVLRRAACWLGASVRVIDQYERGVVLRFGRLRGEVRAARG